MTDRATILKLISFAIGLSGTVKPEKQAESVLDALESKYEIRKRAQ